MRIDIHVHSSRYSPCSWQSPEEMVEAALAANLDGIVFTEHDRPWARRELADLQQQFPTIRLFTGAEMTTAEGEHVLVYGDLDYRQLRPFVQGTRLCQLVRQMGGVSILAHPGRWGQPPPLALLDAVDGLEVGSSNITRAMSWQAQQWAESHGKFVVVASDSHYADTLGSFALDFSTDIADEAALAVALAAGDFSLYPADRY